MKRTFRITIILIFVAIILTGIGFWRHHYLEIMNAEPIKVYKSTPLEAGKSPKDTSVKQEKAHKVTSLEAGKSPKDTSVKSDDNTDVELEPRVTTLPLDNSITSEETDNTDNSPADTIFADLAGVNLPPEAAAALKEYKEIQLAIPVVNRELKPLLDARPIDFDAIGVINEKKRKLKQQRKDSLEILSLYSDDALAELQATIAREKAAARIVDELEENPDMDLEDIKREIESISK